MPIRGVMMGDAGVLDVGRIDAIGIERVDARCLALDVRCSVLGAQCLGLGRGLGTKQYAHGYFRPVHQLRVPSAS